MLARKTFIATSLALSIGFAGITQSAQAAMIGVEQLNQASTSAGDANRARILESLNRADVIAELERQGVSPEQARERIAALSDKDAALLAEKAANAPAGGDIVGAILVVFFVLLLTDILGLTKIFPFTRSIR
ncbi:PA2779 family protein [Pseudogulbenkiania sp. MAI-1]|uniref:PA2779 family protein n=1 Tax=Pseudogulbenkiania sp. MAI-1 TaxID=990370 RepID=UPI00045E9607|nr:PA2779 family protein [Pseudogulbenkiania sp. MAI-1]